MNLTRLRAVFLFIQLLAPTVITCHVRWVDDDEFL